MLTYTVSSNQLAESDIYDIQPVGSLADFLKDHCSLCIIKEPYEGSLVEMTRITGKNRNGESMRIYLGRCPENDQGALKSKLDRMLHSAYLFISWKQRGRHTFKLVQGHHVIAEFPDFQSALDAYFPDGFQPEKSYRRAHSVFELMCMSLYRRKLMRDLVRVLKRSLTSRKKEH